MNERSVLPAFRLLTLFLFTMYTIAPHGIPLPRWYLFYVEKLSIALPLIFIVAGYAMAESGRPRPKAAFRVLILYVLLTTYVFVIGRQKGLPAQMHEATPYIQQLKSSNGELLPFRSYLHLLVLLLLCPIPRVSIGKGFLLLSFLFILTLSVSIFVPSPTTDYIVLECVHNNLFYFFWGALLYNFRATLQNKKIRLSILLLFHAVLFTRLFAPLSTIVRDILNPLYNCLLAAVYTLLAMRMIPLTTKKLFRGLSTYTLEAGALIAAGAVLIWIVFYRLPSNMWLLSAVILIAFILLLAIAAIVVTLLSRMIRQLR